MRRVGDLVKIRGGVYRIETITNMSYLDSKFFGKFKFVLVDVDGMLWIAFGKTVTANSKLTEHRG